MDKKDLILLAEELYQSALEANTYYSIMMQYRVVNCEYNTEMNMSPAFYQVVYGALQKACFIEIAKLYDESSSAASIGKLLNYCKENAEHFPEYSGTETFKYDDIEHTFQIPYHHSIKPQEECFFRDEVARQRALSKLFFPEDSDMMPINVELTFKEILDLYQKRFCGLRKKRKNIRLQRNKIYAHHDKERILLDEKIWETSLVTYPDLQELIEFAIDCTILILEILTGVCRAINYKNIDDLENTLKYVQIGLKYRDKEIKKQHQLILDKY